MYKLYSLYKCESFSPVRLFNVFTKALSMHLGAFISLKKVTLYFKVSLLHITCTYYYKNN